jgi:hypothetical protein
MLMLRRSTHRTALWGVVGAVMVGLVVVGASSSAETPSVVPKPSSTLSDVARAGFAVFATPEGSTWPHFEETRAAVGAPLDPTSVRSVQSADGRAYIMGGSEVVCVTAVLPTGPSGTACAPAPGAASGDQPPIAAVPIKPHGSSQWLVAALVPNGTREVRFGDGPATPIKDNVALTLLDDRPVGVSVTTEDGAVHRLGS